MITVKFHGLQVSFEVGAISGQGGKLMEKHLVMLNVIGPSPEKQLTTRVKRGDSVTVYLHVSGG
jgi:hypothetical protein